MNKLSKLNITKHCALLLVFLVAFMDFAIYAYGSPAVAGPGSQIEEQNDPGQPGQVEGDFAVALKDYKEGLYKVAIKKLTALLEINLKKKQEVKAKAYLLLGACYEKSGQKKKAEEFFLNLKAVLGNGTFDAVPAIPGIDPGVFPTYREIFEKSSFFIHKKPVPVSEMIKKKVVHAPRKSIEQKEKEKTKKKFPWLIAVGAVVVIGVTAVLLLLSKKSEEKTRFPEVQWIHIPAGEFLMGDNFNEGNADEQPVHKVYLNEYFISKYEINTGQFEHFCQETDRTNPWLEAAYNANYDIYDFPIPVSFREANDFCIWLSQKTGEKIRLPTEAEWEKAARSTHQYRYPWGNSDAECAFVNYSDCTFEPGNGHAHSLALFQGVIRVQFLEPGKSPYGAFNMAGNVWEWCRDWYDPGYYSISPKDNPQGPASGTYRVIRGGGNNSSGLGIRSANREGGETGRSVFEEGISSSRIGFRVVKEVPASKY